MVPRRHGCREVEGEIGCREPWIVLRVCHEKLTRGMAHTGPGGSRTIDVICARCFHVVRIRQEPDAHGREKALLHGEMARLHGDLDRIGEEFEEFKVRADPARTADAGRFAEFAAQILEKGIEGMSTVEEMLGELGNIRRQAAAAVPGGGRCGCGGGGDPEQAALIGEMKARVPKLKGQKAAPPRTGPPGLAGCRCSAGRSRRRASSGRRAGCRRRRRPAATRQRPARPRRAGHAARRPSRISRTSRSRKPFWPRSPVARRLAECASQNAAGGLCPRRIRSAVSVQVPPPPPPPDMWGRRGS